MAGGVPKPILLPSPSFDLTAVSDTLRAAFSDKTKLVIFNTPHNPTGHVASAAELSLIASLVGKHNRVVCLCDEVYEACTFPGSTHRRLCEVEGMWDRTLTIGSASKLLSLTGWRIGWVSGPADLVKATATIHAYTSFSAAGPLQVRGHRRTCICALSCTYSTLRKASPPSPPPPQHTHTRSLARSHARRTHARITEDAHLQEGIAAALEAECATEANFEGRAELMHRNFETLSAALRRTGVEVCG